MRRSHEHRQKYSGAVIHPVFIGTGLQEIKKILEEKYGILLSNKAESEADQMCTFSDAILLKGQEKDVKIDREEGILNTLVKNITSLMHHKIVQDAQEAMNL